jgi:hypothetical protein
MYVYRTVMYRETLWNQPGEEQMSRKYSSTIVAMHRLWNRQLAGGTMQQK